jgi:hypothetical protein
MGKANDLIDMRRLSTALALCWAVALALCGVGAAHAGAAGCANEAIREAQTSESLPTGTTYLPDCMALEMLSPPKKLLQPAFSPIFSLDGERVRFHSQAALAGTGGQQDVGGDTYLAIRSASGWEVSPTSPPTSSAIATGTETSGGPYAFSPDFGRWVLLGATQTQASAGVGQLFTGGLDGSLAPLSPVLIPVDNSANSKIVFEAKESESAGTAADLSATVFHPKLTSTSYLPGDPTTNAENNEAGGDKNNYVASVDEGGEPTLELLARDKAGTVYGGRCGTHLGGGVDGTINQGAISADGSRIYFSTRPAQAPTGPCATAVLSATATAGSNVLTSVITARGTGTLTSGSNVLTGVAVDEGEFIPGQTISGSGIPAATMISAVGAGTLTLSQAATASGPQPLASGPQPLAVGQAISFTGTSKIPTDAVITGVSGQTVTLSANATSSGSVTGLTAIHPLRIFTRIETPTGAEIAPLVPGGPAAGSDLYQGASLDGTKIYFTSPRKLTASDLDPSSEECGATIGKSAGCDLYLYDSTKPEAERLTQVSAGGAGDPTPGQGANVLSSVTAISSDGSHAYFAAQGVLTTDPNPEGAVAQAGQPNLYLYQRDAAFPLGHTSFLGTLDPGDRGDSSAAGRGLWGTERSFVGGAYAVPLLGAGEEDGGDGHVLAFASKAPLTADDSDGGHSDVFRYDAEAGTLERISRAAEGGSEAPASDAAVNPNSDAPNTNFAEAGRWVSEDGQTIAFSTAEPLVPGDPDGAANPYLWREGELARLPGKEQFLGVDLPTVSRSGEEIGFSTASALLPQDGDTASDVYVVRAGGGFPNPASATPCDPISEGACQAASSLVPPTSAAATLSFTGPGNEKSRAKCRKGQVRKRGNCLKPHKKKRSQQKRASHKRGGKK